MLRRIPALAAALGLASTLLLGASSPARAQGTGLTVATVPAMILGTIALLTGCFADEPGEGYNRDGWFGGAGFTYGVENFGISQTVGNSEGFNAQLGYRCHPHVSWHLSYEYMTGFSADDPLFAPEVRPWHFMGNVKAHLLTARVQPYLMTGLGVLHADSKNGVTVRFGGGVDFYATENILVGAGISYIAPFDAVENFDYVSFVAELGYRF